ncbi:FecR family protein [Sphingobacterium sp. UBA6645]|uniref:FecR family protein n=1 Tax=Sphingobacterium sp. UBA6645 TaxID=1947511 RepID=UPI0025F74EE8|nr:FecR family protein [Sphingobacterium sp. UBA6645]
MKKEILEKFLSNQCSYNECKDVASYLEGNDDELDKIQLFENLADNEIIHIDQVEKDLLCDAILAKPKQGLLLKRLLIAAAVLLFVAFSFYKLGKHDSPSHLESPLLVEIVNDTESAEWHILPDSSRVKLSPAAKLTYRTNFAKDRELNQVAGEITYFVHANKDLPFRVINQGVQTRAVGTTFSIDDYNNENLIIKLLEGKIVVEDPTDNTDSEIILNNPTAIVVSKVNFTYNHINENKEGHKKAWDKERKSIRNNYSESTIAWSNQVVNFSGVSNADLFSIMERLYGVSIDVENPKITNGNFTGELYQNDNLENLLTIFCQMNGCNFTIKDNIIRIK